MLLYHRTHSEHFGKKNMKRWTSVINNNAYTPRYAWGGSIHSPAYTLQGSKYTHRISHKHCCVWLHSIPHCSLAYYTSYVLQCRERIFSAATGHMWHCISKHQIVNVGAWYTELHYLIISTPFGWLNSSGKTYGAENIPSTLSLICKEAVRLIKYDGCKYNFTCKNSSTFSCPPSPFHHTQHCDPTIGY